MSTTPLPQVELRQQLLIVYTGSSDPRSEIIAWSRFDGSRTLFERPGEEELPPYPNVVEAMRDGWNVLQCPPFESPLPEDHMQMLHFRYRYVLERRVPKQE